MAKSKKFSTKSPFHSYCVDVEVGGLYFITRSREMRFDFHSITKQRGMRSSCDCLGGFHHCDQTRARGGDDSEDFTLH